MYRLMYNIGYEIMKKSLANESIKSQDERRR